MLRAYSISNKYQFNSSELGQIHIAICRMLEKVYQKINDRHNSKKYSNEAWQQEKYLLKDMGYLDPEIEEFYKYHHSNCIIQKEENNEKQETDLQQPPPPPSHSSEEEQISQNKEQTTPENNNNNKQKRGKNRNKKNNNKKDKPPVSFNDQMSLEKKVYLLGYAAKRGKRSLVQQYLEDGIDPNLKNPVTGYTPLHYACWNNYYDIVELLLQYGANPLIKNNEGENSLETARITKNKKLIDLIENKIKDMDISEVEENKEQDNSKLSPNIPIEHIVNDVKEEIDVKETVKEEEESKLENNEENEGNIFSQDVEIINDMEEDINNAIDMYNSLI